MLKLFRFLKPYTLPVIVVVMLVFLQSMAELYLPTLMSDIINKGITNGNVDYIMNTGGFMLLVALGDTTLRCIGGVFILPSRDGVWPHHPRRNYLHILPIFRSMNLTNSAHRRWLPETRMILPKFKR